jgi:hypothetical protein
MKLFKMIRSVRTIREETLNTCFLQCPSLKFLWWMNLLGQVLTPVLDYCHTSVDTEIYRDWWVKERKRDDRDRDIGRGIDMDIIYR